MTAVAGWLNGLYLLARPPSFLVLVAFLKSIERMELFLDLCEDDLASKAGSQ